MLRDIVIKGAKENNLKNIDLTIPREKLVVFTGVSGSGKSTLAFDTIFAEGQRRYMESLSSYARQFLGQMNKPNVDSIDGLSPSISIDQKTTSHNPRSTVGTVTEIHDYLRLLFAHVGVPYCPNCNIEIKTTSIDVIIDKIMEMPTASKIMVMANIAKGKKGRFEKEFEDLKKEGFARVYVDGEIRMLDEEIKLDKNIKHTIYVVVDRLIVKEGIEKRLTESVETALKITKGLVSIFDEEGIEKIFSTTHSCEKCGYSLEELAPRLFSFNTPFGACPECSGIGFKQIIDPSKVVVNENASLFDGAIMSSGWSFDSSMSNMFFRAILNHFNLPQDIKFRDMPTQAQDMVLYGTRGEKIVVSYKSNGMDKTANSRFEGVIPNLERRYRDTESEYVKNELGKLFMTLPCDLCKGKRYRKEALSVYINGKNIVDVSDMSINNCLDFFENLDLTKTQEIIATPILKEIKNRLGFLLNVGLKYLTLSRMAGTLSGGESQRIRLATQIGSGLTGVIYILDEPSIGLHQRDNEKLIKTLEN